MLPFFSSHKQHGIPLSKFEVGRHHHAALFLAVPADSCRCEVQRKSRPG